MRTNNGQPSPTEADKWLDGLLEPPKPPAEPPPSGPRMKRFAPGELAEFKRRSKLRRN